jgi:hypothetical protein
MSKQISEDAKCKTLPSILGGRSSAKGPRIKVVLCGLFGGHGFLTRSGCGELFDECLADRRSNDLIIV